MKRIYTGTGDRGMTAIHGGSRVAKTDIRIEANGSLDELNVAIGIVRSFLPTESAWQSLLKDIQTTMMTVMSLVATPGNQREHNPNKLPENCVEEIEREIDRISGAYGDSDYFLLPGGTPAGAFLHQCRVAARRGERRLWELNETDPVPEMILRYVNRLSDLFFVMARADAQGNGMDEERWKLFTYKRRKQ